MCSKSSVDFGASPLLRCVGFSAALKGGCCDLSQHLGEELSNTASRLVSQCSAPLSVTFISEGPVRIGALLPCGFAPRPPPPRSACNLGSPALASDSALVAFASRNCRHRASEHPALRLGHKVAP